MHNELNDNSTTPEKPTTHHYDESGALIVTDVIQYFQDNIESSDIYSIRLYLAGKDEANLSLVHARKSDFGNITAKLNAEQAETLWAHILKFEKELELTCGNRVGITEKQIRATERWVTLKKQTRISAHGIRQKEAYDFVQAAYSAGINIIIEGETYSGKSYLLNTLMDSAKDYNPTILLNKFPEMIFGNDHREITEIRSDNPSSLIYQARRMDPYRVVMDDVSVTEENMQQIVSATLTGTQFVATGYTSRSASSDCETDQLSSQYKEHPYELRVHVGISFRAGINLNDETKLEFNLLSVSQIVHQKVGNSDTTSNRLLFDRERKVAEPTRVLRRKMEAALRLRTKPSQRTLENNPKFDEPPVSTFVSLTPEEKAELEEHCAVLSEHFKLQNITLRTRFRAIENLLAKF